MQAITDKWHKFDKNHPEFADVKGGVYSNQIIEKHRKKLTKSNSQQHTLDHNINNNQEVNNLPSIKYKNNTREKEYDREVHKRKKSKLDHIRNSIDITIRNATESPYINPPRAQSKLEKYASARAKFEKDVQKINKLKQSFVINQIIYV